MPPMKPSYRNKPAGPHPANSLLGLLSLGIAVAALAIAIIALVRTTQPHSHEHAGQADTSRLASSDTPPTPPTPEPSEPDRPTWPQAPDPPAGGVPDPPTPAEAEAEPDELVKADEPYVAPAGRSPIPREGESIDKPRPPKTLDVPPDGVAPPEGEVIAWDQAAQHLGYDVTVEGRIVDTHLIESGAICFLNFKENDREAFYLAMFREAFEDLPQPPQDYYLGKTIRVTGLVKTHKGRPQIEVHSNDQIEVVNGS